MFVAGLRVWLGLLDGTWVDIAALHLGSFTHVTFIVYYSICYRKLKWLVFFWDTVYIALCVVFVISLLKFKQLFSFSNNFAFIHQPITKDS